MKNTGIVRNVDNLGRVVLPKELRRMLSISTGSPMEIYISDDTIVLQKYHRGCIFCHSLDDIVEFKGKVVCDLCLKEITKMR